MLERLELELHNPPKKRELRALGCSCSLFLQLRRGWGTLLFEQLELKLHNLLDLPKQLELYLLDMLEQLELDLHNTPEQLELHTPGCSHNFFFDAAPGMANTLVQAAGAQAA